MIFLSEEQRKTANNLRFEAFAKWYIAYRQYGEKIPNYMLGYTAEKGNIL